MKWMLMPLKRYADFQGRSRRMEYWLFTLGYVLVVTILIVLAIVTTDWDNFRAGDLGPVTWAILILLGLIVLALIIPSIAAQVRRLHDQNLSGWYVLVAYILSNIPFIGLLVSLAFLVVLCLPGTRGPNRFGPDPKDPYAMNDIPETFG